MDWVRSTLVVGGVGFIGWTVVRVLRTLRGGGSTAPGGPDLAELRRKHPGALLARHPGTCVACGHRFDTGALILWDKRTRTASHADCQAERRAREAEALARLIQRIDEGGENTRKHVLASGMKLLEDPELRTQLILEASRIEAEAALESADALATATQKRQRLEGALARIRSDEVPDEMQAEQISWLEEALAKLGGPKRGAA